MTATPELVLSNTTSFFLGGMERAFRNARKYGFRYLEVVPYRWITPEIVRRLEKTYGVQVAGIHLPDIWGNHLWREWVNRRGVLEKLLGFVWLSYLGPARKNPGLAIIEALNERKPYLLLHANLLPEIGTGLIQLASKANLVVENIPYQPQSPRFFWDPVAMREFFKYHGLPGGITFDPGHFHQTMKRAPQELSLLKTYELVRPEILHISYNDFFIHTLPNRVRQNELVQLLKIHQPRYLVLETNPLVSIKKGKRLLEGIISQISA